MNNGPYVGDVVILAYMIPKSLPDQTGSKLLQKLFDFKRFSDVPIGGTVSASFSVSSVGLALTDLSTGNIVSTPGVYELLFTDGSRHELRCMLTVVGKQQIIEMFPVV